MEDILHELLLKPRVKDSMITDAVKLTKISDYEFRLDTVIGIERTFILLQWLSSAIKNMTQPGWTFLAHRWEDGKIIFNIGDIPIDEKYTIDDYYVEYMKHAQEAYQAGITHERLYYDLAFFGAEKATMIERPKGYKRPINFYQIKNTIWGHDSLFFDFGYVLYSLNKSRLSPEAKSLLDLMSDAYWDMDYINIMEDSKFAKTDWGKLFKERYKKWHIRQHPFMPLRFMYENRDVTDLCPDDALRAVVLNSTVKHENAGVISQIIYCFGKGNYRYDMKFLNNIIKY